MEVLFPSGPRAPQGISGHGFPAAGYNERGTGDTLLEQADGATREGLQARGFFNVLFHPAGAMAVGLLAFPVAKLLYLPNFVFNFLAVLVHEIGHCVFAWLMGRPSVPGIGLVGGGVTVWSEPWTLLRLLVMAGLGGLAYRFRSSKIACGFLVAALVAYPLVAFTGMNELPALAGGILFEIGGAAACFFVVLARPLRRPFERPLYALWGWWMLLNRGGETLLMFRDPGAWEANRVSESGLSAGLVNDLPRICEELGWSPRAGLGLVLLLCVLAPLAAAAAAWFYRHARKTP